MSGRPPCSPRAAWLEEAGASPASRPQPQPYEETEVQPLQAPSGSGVGPSASAVAHQEEEDALSFLRACCSRRPKREAQKLRFLASICDACQAAVADPRMWDAVYFCQLEVAQSIEALLQEEPSDRLDTEVRQKAMLAIAAMSTARLLPQGMTNGILRACFRGVFHLPGHEDGTDMDTSLYVRTVEALDSLLQALVSSAGACGLLELQNILKLLLPFTQQQPEAMEERAMVRIAGLAAFLNTCSLPQVSSCFAGATVLRHHHPEKHRFALLGRLVGYLLLCCTCESEGKSHEAAKAVRHLCLFVTQQRSTRLCDQDAEQPQGWQSWRARLSLRLSEDSNSNRMFMIFMKYLQPSERLGVFLAAVQSMRAPSPHSTELAAHMVDVLAAETDFHSGQVLHIVWAIYRSLPSVRAALALQSLDRALLLLASKRPRETVASLLQCSLTCTSVAVTMWRAMVSEPPATERVLHELLRILMNQSGCKTSTSTKHHLRIQALAAARPLHEILLLPTSRGEAKAIFPQLFLALLFQVSFTTELKLQEVQVFWEKHQQDLLTPVRSTVQALKALLRSVGLGSQVLAIEAQGVWAALLSAESHLWGVQVVAREMKELPRSLRTTIIHQLVELLRTEASSWQTVAMVILSKVSRGSRSSEPTWGSAQALLPRGQAWPCPGIPALAFLLLSRHCAPRPFQLLECTELGDELDCVVSLFASYLRSPCLGMQSLVLRAILGLTERPATVSGGSRQRHECRGLGWAGPGLLWLGTLPGSGEGKGRWAGWESVFAQGAVIAFPKGRCFVHTGEANARPAAEHHGAAAGCRQRHPRCRSAHAQHHAAAPGGEDAQPRGSGAGQQAPSPLWRRLKYGAASLYLPLPRHAGLCGGQPREAAAGGTQEPAPAVLPPARPGRERGRGLPGSPPWCRALPALEAAGAPGRDAQSWKISECLLARRSSAAEEYLAQSLPYLQSLQEPLQREAVRFTGLVGRHLLDQHQSKSQDICQVLRGLANDPCESVSSLAIQTCKHQGHARASAFGSCAPGCRRRGGGDALPRQAAERAGELPASPPACGAAPLPGHVASTSPAFCVPGARPKQLPKPMNNRASAGASPAASLLQDPRFGLGHCQGWQSRSSTGPPALRAESGLLLLLVAIRAGQQHPQLHAGCASPAPGALCSPPWSAALRTRPTPGGLALLPSLWPFARSPPFPFPSLPFPSLPCPALPCPALPSLHFFPPSPFSL
eukprot:XP_027304065.1 uncharacterized protein LOC113841602 isoform X2 [Anas platyrhynchos]